ncbi:hypothetical protein Nepgr_014884 [Nepenthes gracilis]|uniref:Pentatricopeptide repeat-containing protein n=1 Tax=Nepenthes gracilis TaxID=150966 RepID=A0AAD3SKX4_NEPGR|nr:hypothetical protein Nepgr_014884 [Nepenthes gracilis]
MISHARRLLVIPTSLSISSPLSSLCLQLFLSSTTSSGVSPTSCLCLTVNSQTQHHNHSNLLSICSSLKSIPQTKQTHALAVVQGLLPESVSLSAALILNYATFGDFNSFRNIFEHSVPFCRTAFLWNTLMRGNLIAGIYDDFATYNRMIRSNIRPDDHTFPSILKMCADYSVVQKGKEVHGFVVKAGLGSELYVGNTLLVFYSCCGSLRDVRNVFDEMTERDVVSWNTTIGALSVYECYHEAVNFFFDMKLESGFMPNLVTVVSVLPVCARLEDEGMSRLVHCYVVKVGLDNQVKIGNALVDAYGKCGNVGSSRQVFDEMVEKNVISWNAIITSYAHVGFYNDALHMFIAMIDTREKPNGVTISSTLPVLVELECFDTGKEIHGFCIRMGLDSDLFIANSLIDMYAKSEHPSQASNVFYRMGLRNVVSWNAMVANFTQNSCELVAIDYVRRMQDHGEKPNAVTFTNVLPACARVSYLCSGKEIHARSIRDGFASDLFLSNTLTDMYAKCGQINLARKIFDVSLRDHITYNILIVGYSQTGECLESLNLFREMGVMGLKQDTVSLVGIIAACANLAALKKGKEIHGFVVRNLFHTHLFVANSLLDLYTKCGRTVLAQNVFEHISDRDAASWNTMILGHGMLGEVDTAIDLFEAMREDIVDYDAVSFVAVLSACSHRGLVEKGKRYFEEMLAKGIRATHLHYACMVDLLGRAGLMKEAVELIKELPIEPDAAIWAALLGVCRIHGNVEVAVWAAEHLFLLKPDHCGYYILLSNMLSEAGRWDEAKRVRELMKSHGVDKNPGCSWVQVRERVHTFLVGESVEELNSVLWVVKSGCRVYV